MNSIIKLAPGIEKIAEGSLYPFQSDGVTFLLSKKRAILADDTGVTSTRKATPMPMGLSVIFASGVLGKQICPFCRTQTFLKSLRQRCSANSQGERHMPPTTIKLPGT